MKLNAGWKDIEFQDKNGDHQDGYDTYHACHWISRYRFQWTHFICITVGNWDTFSTKREMSLIWQKRALRGGCDAVAVHNEIHKCVGGEVYTALPVYNEIHGAIAIYILNLVMFWISPYIHVTYIIRGLIHALSPPSAARHALASGEYIAIFSFKSIYILLLYSQSVVRPLQIRIWFSIHSMCRWAVY